MTADRPFGWDLPPGVTLNDIDPPPDRYENCDGCSEGLCAIRERICAELRRLRRIEAYAQDHVDVCREPGMGMTEAEGSLKALEEALRG